MSHKKLVLGSGGVFFENEECPLLNHVISLAEKKENFLFLPTAGHDTYADDEIALDYFKRHGFTKCTSLHLSNETHTDEELRDLILGADVIYARGGNLQFLLQTWRKTGVIPYFKQAYENGTVMAGHSSGAMCWCRHGYDDCRPNDAYMFLDGLDFIPYILCPHFEDWQCFLTDVKMQEWDALAIDNDIMISIVDGEYTIVDSHRNPKHSAFYLPANEDFAVHDLQKEHLPLPGLDGKTELYR